VKPGRRPDVQWDRATVLYALELWHRRHLRPPAAWEWARAGIDHPSRSTVARLFGSWNRGLRAAGFRVRGGGERRWTPEQTAPRWTAAMIITCIQRWAAVHGRPPMKEEWRRSGEGHPSATTVQRRFGSWNDAISASGFAPRARGETLRPRAATHRRCSSSGRWISARAA
jgi:hypothetical protein